MNNYASIIGHLIGPHFDAVENDQRQISSHYSSFVNICGPHRSTRSFPSFAAISVTHRKLALIRYLFLFTKQIAVSSALNRAEFKSDGRISPFVLKGVTFTSPCFYLIFFCNYGICSRNFSSVRGSLSRY